MNLYQAYNSPSFKSIQHTPDFLDAFSQLIGYLTGGVPDFENLPADELELLRGTLAAAHFHHHTMAAQRGYVNSGKMALMLYAGRYGVGYAIMTHNGKSSNLYNVEYWVI